MSEPDISENGEPIVRRLVPGDLLKDGFHVRLNREALAHAPVIYLIRNEGFADGVPLPLAFANPCLVDLAPAYRLRGARIRGEAALETALARAAACCVAGHGPVLLEWLPEEAEK